MPSAFEALLKAICLPAFIELYSGISFPVAEMHSIGLPPSANRRSCTRKKATTVNTGERQKTQF